MKYLITGGCGFLGSNLANEVLQRDEELIIFDNFFRTGSILNYDWLKTQGSFQFYHNDIRNYNDVETVIKMVRPDNIFHLAGQVAMTTSLKNPRVDFEINTLGTHNLLECVRKYSEESILLYSSTNKVYGDLEWVEYDENETRYNTKNFPNGFPENIQLEFQSPYGCSKGAADQYILDYARMYGLKTAVFRHSSMFGGRQHATVDQGWVTWFCQKALEIKHNLLKEKITISGNGKQVRDILFIKDLNELYFSSIDKISYIKGQAFNIGGGMKNSLSILELFSWLEEKLSISIKYTNLPVRESDQKVFVADNSKIASKIGWKPSIDKNQGLIRVLDWLETLMD